MDCAKKNLVALCTALVAVMSAGAAIAQERAGVEKAPWVPDIGGGKYRNPILFADYSDPDVCRKGSEFFLVASSFNQVPGLPILESRDLVNWEIIGHALPRLVPCDHYDTVRPGDGVWAPAIRFHDGMFCVYYPDPDYGIYRVTAENPAGPWSEPQLVMAGKGLEDPCPFWDKDGKAYLIHAFAGSRAGIKSVLVLNRMNAQGTKVIDNGEIVYDGHGIDPTIEGPKLYRRGRYYYIFAPAGGVQNGWQVVLRSKDIYGPYERKVVLHQGNTAINGPHQGAWIETAGGQSWFIHFQDRGAYGRVDWLEPMKWVNGWPMIGTAVNNGGVGEPVMTYTKPDVGGQYPAEVPQTSDEFNGRSFGLQWQWQANPRPTWWFMIRKSTGNAYDGYLRLYAQSIPVGVDNYWTVPNILSQKFPAESFTATTKVTFTPLSIGDRTGLIVIGSSYACLYLVRRPDGIYLAYATCDHADKGSTGSEELVGKAPDSTAYMRVSVAPGAVCSFSYSYDGAAFTSVGPPFIAAPGRWIGAKLGIFCTSKIKSHDSGFADFDWFRVR